MAEIAAAFIGYSAGFPLLSKIVFPEVNALPFLFLGPLVGALNVPLVLATPSNGSHYLCDIIGGAAIAFAALVLVTGLERRRAPAMRLAGQTN